ncbi:MAG: glycosyltransferase family 2 protein [Bacteroidales bacterium]|nr:glycosyltransferase family 2 protein [Bacteroidales bacterium]
MPRISVVIITCNEEQNIGRCIDSVKEVADDIVVLDSGSADNTINIAKEKGARVFQHGFDNFVAQKNRALTYASFPHILSLDADEALSQQLKDSILEIKNNWKHDGYKFNRLTNFCGRWIRHGGWYPDCRIRLWDSSKGNWQGNRLHETVKLNRHSSVGFLKGNMLHYSFYSVSQHIGQINKYTDISSKAAYDKGKRTNRLEIFFKPKWKFLRDYLFKLGFLDGFYGYVVCRNSAFAKYLKYTKLYQLSKNAEKQ